MATPWEDSVKNRNPKQLTIFVAPMGMPERLIGSVRREFLDHVVIFLASHAVAKSYRAFGEAIYGRKCIGSAVFTVMAITDDGGGPHQCRRKSGSAAR